MRLRLTAAADLETWPGTRMVTLGAPPGQEHSVAPAEVIVDELRQEFHVPWKPDEWDIGTLFAGGTIWLTVMGGLPPHRLDVRGDTESAAPVADDAATIAPLTTALYDILNVSWTNSYEDIDRALRERGKIAMRAINGDPS